MKKNLFYAMLLSTSMLSAQEISIDTSLTSDEPGVIQQYWYWAGGVKILGEDFAANADITVTSVDPAGNTWRDFTGVSTADGKFEIQINAMRNRSILGTHIVTAKDNAGNTATATFEVVKSPKDVLDVTTNPTELSLIDLLAGEGLTVTMKNVAPNGLVKLNLMSPDGSGMEIAPIETKYADANGEYTIVLDGNTEVGTMALTYQIPAIPGKWTVSTHDFSGTNNTGATEFRVWPSFPSTSDYCTIALASTAQAFPITYVELNDLVNTSSATSTAYYEDYTAKSAQLAPGKTYDIKIKGKNMNAWTVDTYTAFIDWNQDGVLDGDGEVISLGFIKDSTGEDNNVLVGKITVPENVTFGETRMRILKVRSVSSTAMFWPIGACGIYSEGQVEDYTLNIGELSTENVTKEKSKVYPNPVKNVLNIDNTKAIQKVVITDVSGRKVLEKTINNKNAQVNVSSLNAGVYFVQTTSENGIETFKIIKK